MAVLLHAMDQRAKRFGRRSIVERVPLGNQDAERATQIAKLPLRVIEVATSRVGRQPTHVYLRGLGHQRCGIRSAATQQRAIFTERAEQAHGRPPSVLQDGKRHATGHRMHGLIQSDMFSHLALLHEQITQPNTVQHFIDLALQEFPDRSNAAVA